MSFLLAQIAKGSCPFRCSSASHTYGSAFQSLSHSSEASSGLRQSLFSELGSFPLEPSLSHPYGSAHKYRSWLLVLGAGILSFGTLLIELFLVLSNISFGLFYFEFGFLLVTLLSLIAVCAIVSVILSYTRLRVGDWCWWWKAFFASVSVGIYAFLYSIFFLVVKLRGLSGPVSAVIYTGYSLIMAVAVMLAIGTIGFLVSFFSVHRLYSSAKIDC